MSFAASPARPRGFRVAAGAIVALAAAAGCAQAQMPAYAHVVVVVMENHSYGDIIGNAADAPFLNALAAQGANLTQSFAIEHPSEPNYLDLFSGANQGVTDDSCPHTFANVANLGSQLIGAGFSFVGYAEDLPADKPQTCTSGNYARKHNPWVNFTNVPAQSNQPFSAFPTDYAKLPSLAFVVPNLCNDMHNCPIATGDAWLQSNLGAYAAWATTHDSLLVVTWDEDDYSEANQVATIIAGAHVKPGDYADASDHFRLLATLEALFGLPPIAAAAQRQPLTSMWDTPIFSDGFDAP